MSMGDDETTYEKVQGLVDAEMAGRPKTRSTSLKAALAALGDGDAEKSKTDQGNQQNEAEVSAKEEADRALAVGRPKTKVFSGDSEELKYHQEPVVGWLVVAGGPGLGAYRPIFMGSNTIGSDAGQRIPINFGDEYISKEEQAYIRYDPDDRQFLFIPNLAKTNVVSIDDVKPTSAVRLMPYDIISMGHTKLVFIPFCGEEFDWSELPFKKK